MRRLRTLLMVSGLCGCLFGAVSAQAAAASGNNSGGNNSGGSNSGGGSGQSNAPTVIDQNTSLQQLILMRALQSRRSRGGVRTGVPNPIINVGPPALMPMEDPLAADDSSAGSSKRRKSSSEKRADAARKKEEQKQALREKNEKKLAAAKAKADKNALKDALKRKADAAERIQPVGKNKALGEAMPNEELPGDLPLEAGPFEFAAPRAAAAD